MKILSAKGEGRQVRLRPADRSAQADPVAVAKRGRPVVVLGK
jgi:hypothetical protein